jgi:Protein of unknown function (DUF4239)
MLNNLLYNDSVLVSAVFVVGATIAFGFLGLLLTDRLVSRGVRREHSDVLGPAAAIVSVVYAVLIAFIASQVLLSFNRGDELATREASLVGYLYVDASLMPEPSRGQVSSLLEAYLHMVIQEEWPTMNRGERPGQKGLQLLKATYLRLAAVRTEDPIQVALFAEMLGRLNALVDARIARIAEAENVLHPAVWFVLLIGAAITMAFCWLLGFRHSRMYVATNVMVSISIGLVIFLIVAFDYPYRGGVRISAEAYQRVLDNMGSLGQESAPAM